MKILMVAAEMVPFLRTSDVATVVTGLSQALQQLGHDVRIVIPRYRTLQFAATINVSPVIDTFDVPLGDYSSKASLSRLDYEGLPVYLIENQTYFGRDDPYGYLDDYERFIFFTRAIVEMLRNDAFTTGGWYPEIIHGHDWISGFLPMWMRHTYKDFFGRNPIAFVYTVHNASFPGRFGYRALSVAGLTDLGILRPIGEDESSISFLARGILAADAVNTVSQQHAKEILQEEYTRALAQALRLSKKEMNGILNGFDYATYDPAFDDIITYRYSRDRMHLRRENKQLLQAECDLTPNLSTPLLGFISRLIPEKGAGLLAELLPSLLREDKVQVIIVGVVGDYHYREVFTRMQEEYHTQFVPFFTALDDPLSRKLLAAADMMLIPSLREPCGLQQMLSMRYGAIPIAHLTGGLVDTVAPWSESASLDIGKGFVFDEANTDAFLQATRAALCLYNTDQQAWQELQRHNMKVEFPWYSAASRYVELYKQALENSRKQRTLPLLQEQYELTLPDQWDLLVQSILEGSELTSTIVDWNEYLQQVARSIRELLNGDAVLIWTPDEMDPQLFHPEGYSFRHANASSNPFNPRQYPLYAERDSRSWQYIYSLVPKEGIANSELGFLSSGLARQHAWVTQMTMPMRTHGVFLGKVDVFTCNHACDFSERDMSILRAFTTALAVNLENADFRKTADRLFAADRQMAQAQTVDDIAHCALRHAMSLTRATICHLYAQLGQDFRTYTLDENGHFTPHVTHLSPTTLTSEVTDGYRTNGEHAEQLRARRSSLLHARLMNFSNQDIGKIVVTKPRPIAFSRNDDAILQALARQVAIFLQAASLREKEDNSRVDQLRKLADSLFGGVDFNTLLQKVLATIADVLQSKAASLYLMNEETDVLEIRAAHGNHNPLLQKKVSYQLGEGITGWIAKQGKTFRADSPEQLRDNTHWIGKHKHLHGNVDPNAFLGIPLKATDLVHPEQQIVIGVLKLEDREDDTIFTLQDERLGEMMANVIATVIQNERLSNRRLLELNANLQQFSKAMVGDLEMSVLVQRIVDTIAEVVGADASALYLIEPGSDILKIWAATGYQAALVPEGTQYNVHGPGVTAWIAREGKSFNAKNATELQKHPYWAGKYKHLHGDVDPNAFLGIPLKIITTGGREEIIGVLKVEGVHPSSRHPEAYFTEQDQLLGEMMGNVIATVIQNTRLSDTRLRELNANLRTLSEAMVGGLEMSVLVERTVNTITEVVGADASALYLIEPGSDVLKIRAATGYQAALVPEGTQYNVHGPGVTAWIAREGKPFNAKSGADLRKHPNWAGKYKHLHGGVDPNAFLGIPLKIITTGGREEIIGVLKVEGVHPSSRHPEAYFTEQDQLLVEVMGNVITTVIQNTRLSDTRLLELRRVIVKCITSAINTTRAGSDRRNAELIYRMMRGVVDILGPSAALDSLQSFVHSTDATVLEALSRALLSSFSYKGQISTQEQIAALLNQTQLLLSFNPNPALFRAFAIQNEDKEVKRWYDSVYQLYHSEATNRAKLLDALQLASLWQEARDSARLALSERFRQASKGLAAALASIANKNAELVGEVGLWTAFKLPDITADTELHLPSHLPLLFFRGLHVPSQDDLNSFRLLLQQLQREGIGHIVSIVSLLPEPDADQFAASLRQQMKTLVVDSLFLTLEDMQRIVSSTNPRGILISLLLKQVNLLTLSPYRTSGPTDKKMFYGRAIELRDISEHIVSRSYAIIGGRRVGKSSLLILLHQHNLPDAGIRSLYHDCSTSATYEEFMQAPIRLWQAGEMRKDLPTTFRELLLTPPEDKPLVLLLDEADKLIPADRECDWPLFKKLRNFINSGRGNIVLSGERTLRKALEDAGSPLYNFAETKVLGPLDYQAVEGLITVPMKQLEIKLIDEKAIVDAIWEATDGHPNIVQRICDRLIALLNKRGVRQITPDNVDDILNTPDFQESDFLSTYWEQASELEKLITLLMVRAGDIHYTRARIVHLLAENAIAAEEQAVKDALMNLDTLRSILRRNQDGYSFAFNFFPQVLTNIGVEELFHIYKKVYLDQETNW